MKRIIKTILKILAVIFLVLILIAAGIYFFVLQYPNLKENPKVDKWYRITTDEMKTSEGDP